MTRHAPRVTGLLLAALSCAACGADRAPDRTPRELQEEASRAASRLDWDEAAMLYRRAFAMEDPRPERRQVRGWLAMRSGWALHRAGFPADALLWLRWADRLDPSLAPVHFERALILDGVYPETASPAGARRAFETFLEVWEANGSAPEMAPLAEQARQRIRDLTDGDSSGGD